MPALFVVWIVGYFAFCAASLWLKSGCRPRYRRPMVTYGSVTVVCGVVVLLREPAIAPWGAVFAPALAAGLWAALRRRERTVWAGAVTVAVAAAMTVVAYQVGAGVDMVSAWAAVGPLAGLLFAYFFGTVLYVKSMIRGRGIRGYAVASIGYHAVCVLTLLALALLSDSRWWWAAAFFAGLTLRAAVLVGRTVSPKSLGIGEVVASVVVLAGGLAVQ